MKPTLGGRITHIAAWVILSILIIPSLVAFPVSVTSKTYLSLPWDGVSLQHFRNLFTSAEWMASFGQSLVIAPGVPHAGRARTACRVLDVFAPARDDYR